MSESKEFEAFGKEIVGRVEKVAKDKGATMAQVATAWVLANDGILRYGRRAYTRDLWRNCGIEFEKAD
jgi:hypothetical protein